MAKDQQTERPGGREISREEAREKRRRFLEQAEREERLRNQDQPDINSQDNTLANMILPGGE